MNHNRAHHRRLLFAGCLISAIVAAGTAQAQGSQTSSMPAPGTATSPQPVQSADQTSGNQLQEIIVTAQRRAENLQNVPIAVTAIGGTALSSAGIQSSSQLSEVVPGLMLTSVAGSTQVRIRGIGTNVFGPGIENAVATYVDGVYMSSTNGMIFDLARIERIEVLKGPQGTLFGRNATGGLIQIVTADPPKNFEGLVRATYGNYNRAVGDLYLGGGLTDTLSADLTVHYAHQADGYGRNLYTGNDINRPEEDFIIRSKVAYKPQEGMKFILAGDYSLSRGTSGSVLQVMKGTENKGLFGQLYPVANYGGFYDTNQTFDDFDDTKNYGGSLTAEINLGSAQLQSITAYRQIDFYTHVDLDYQPADALDFAINQHTKQFTQELKVSGDAGRLKYTAGVFYFNSMARVAPQTLRYGPQGTFFFSSAFGGPFSSVAGITHIDNDLYTFAKADSEAAYGQGTYALTPTISVTGGLRYTHERKSAGGTQSLIAYSGSGSTVLIPQGTPFYAAGFQNVKTWDNLSYRVAVDKKINHDLMVYATVNSGFRSGGYNIGVAANTAFNPETITAYEVGVKSELLGGTTRLNLSGFWYKYHNIQVSSFVAGNIVISNGPQAESRGFEADFETRVSHELTLNAGVSYTVATFTNYPNADYHYIGSNCDPAQFAAQGGTCSANATGNWLPNTPRFSGNIGFQYEKEFGNAKVGLTGNLFHSSKWYGSIDNDPQLVQKSYNLLNASFYIEPGLAGLRFTAFGRNLGGVHYYRSDSVAFGQAAYTPAAPRTYGISVEKKF